MSNRYTPHVAVRKQSPNYSSRNGVRPKLIVVHSTESGNRTGTGDLEALAAWFANPAAQVSSHVATDADGYSARFVADGDKAWHCAGFNSLSLGVEQIGRAAQTSWDRDELRETARWVARWSYLHGIPIQNGQINQSGNVLVPGVLRHSDLGALGGSHHDPGSGYPLHDMLSLARFYRTKI